MRRKIFLSVNALLLASALLMACAAPTESPAGPTVTPLEPTATAAVVTSPAYKDARVPIEERVEDLLSRMTLAEKIGQMTLVEVFLSRTR